MLLPLLKIPYVHTAVEWNSCVLLLQLLHKHYHCYKWVFIIFVSMFSATHLFFSSHRYKLVSSASLHPAGSVVYIKWGKLDLQEQFLSTQLKPRSGSAEAGLPGTKKDGSWLMLIRMEWGDWSIYNFFAKYKYQKKGAARIVELDYMIPVYGTKQPFRALWCLGQICYFHWIYSVSATSTSSTRTVPFFCPP